MTRRRSPSLLTPTQRYAAGALLALSLRQAQIHQTRPLGVPPLHQDDEGLEPEPEEVQRWGKTREDPKELWTHESRGLLRPVFRFLEIDSKAWPGIEETAASSLANHHVGAFLRLLFEETNETSSENLDQETALGKAVDAMVMTLETSIIKETKEEKLEYERHCRQRSSFDQSTSDEASTTCEISKLSSTKSLSKDNLLDNINEEKSMLGNIMDNNWRKETILYELLSACIADSPQEKNRTHRGYDARHRAALRLLTTWFDLQSIKMDAVEMLVSCSAMAAVKEAERSEGSQADENSWSKWKRGGIIGAAAVTGGTLLAITGGLAAPAIAAGFGALAPTLGTIIPAIGASGFAAAASAAGSVAGSVAVAASFGAAGAGLSGSKMARRIGTVEEFEFKTIGNNHNQGHLAVGIFISGFVSEDDDFVRPWEHTEENLERYVIQWETKNLIAVSNAIQDWITSRLTYELMKQGAMMTVLHALVTALAWPSALFSAIDFIDSTWTIAVDRSDKAGKLLAEVLLKGLQGHRPVTLVGFSLGARVVFKCLQHLAESGDNEGLVERVVLLGAPIALSGEPWECARKMVAGRFVNVYSTNDWILGVTFRASLLTKGLAGIQAVEVPGIENVDVTEFLDGHSSYLWAARDIINQLELDTYYPVFASAPSGSSRGVMEVFASSPSSTPPSASNSLLLSVSPFFDCKAKKI